jgi:hypothetical protein
MLKMMDRRPTVQTIDGWATSVLLEAGAIREYKERGRGSDRSSCQAASGQDACEEPPLAFRKTKRSRQSRVS